MIKQKLYRYDVTGDAADMIADALAALSPDTYSGQRLAYELENLFRFGRVTAKEYAAGKPEAIATIGIYTIAREGKFFIAYVPDRTYSIGKSETLVGIRHICTEAKRAIELQKAGQL